MPINSHVVTAVLVAHDGAAWIPSVTRALRNQTRPVQRVVAVDTGSQDRSGALLAEALGRGAVFGMDPATGYGAAVRQALRHRAANTYVPPPPGVPQEERAEWVWLLHDDCEPEADALEQLLRGADQVPAAAVLGPKAMDWSDREVLLEAGVTIDRASRRITGIEPREVDQGQHDGDRDVLAVGSAGMLIRRDVWDQVGGFDPGMLLYREDVDFCWRVQAAGYRVRVVTNAVVYHAEAAARNRRRSPAAPRRGRQARRNTLLTLLTNLPTRPMLAVLAGNTVASAMRTLFFLIAKRPGAALDELAAFTSVTGHPLRLLAARRHRSNGRRAAYSRLRAYLPPGRSLRKFAEFAAGTFSKRQPVTTVGSHHATDDPSEDDSLLTDSGLVQRLLTNPGVLLFLGLTVVTLVAARSLLAAGPLGGGALVPAWGGASDLWQEYLQGFHPVALGTAVTTPPSVALLAVLATLLGGKPWLAVDVILIGCVPLAGATAYLATRRVTRFTPARTWAAATYALLPVGMGAVAAGRLGTAAVLVLLPLAGVTAARMFTEPRRRARRAAWATGLILAVAAAFVPLAWLVAVVATAVGVMAIGRDRLAGALDAVIVAVVPVVVLLPWTLGLVAHPSRLFLGTGLQPPGLSGLGLPARSVLMLSPGGPGLPPPWVSAGLAAVAIAALLAGGRRVLVLAGWGAAVIGMMAAAAVSLLIVTPPGQGAPVPAWPGVALAFAGAGLLLAVAATGDAIAGRWRAGRWHTPGGLAVVLLAAVACSAPALAAAFWVRSGVSGPVAPVAGPLLPEFVSVSSDNGLRLRTLVLRASGDGVTYSVLRSTDPPLGSADLTMPPHTRRLLDRTVAALAAPHGGDVQPQGTALAGFGIGYVLMPAPANTRLARLLDGVPGLQPVSTTPAFELWQVVAPTARVTVTEPGGKVATVPSGTVSVTGAKAPAAGGTLVLAEPAGGWHASLNGHPLTPLKKPVDGWAQGFHLPAGGGSLSISRSQAGRDVAVALEGVAVLVVAGLGLPGARVAGDESAEDAAQAERRRAGGSRGRAARGSSRPRRSLWRSAARAGQAGQAGPPAARAPAGPRAGRPDRRLRGRPGPAPGGRDAPGRVSPREGAPSGRHSHPAAHGDARRRDRPGGPGPSGPTADPGQPGTDRRLPPERGGPRDRPPSPGRGGRTGYEAGRVRRPAPGPDPGGSGRADYESAGSRRGRGQPPEPGGRAGRGRRGVRPGDGPRPDRPSRPYPPAPRGSVPDGGETMPPVQRPPRGRRAGEYPDGRDDRDADLGPRYDTGGQQR